MSKTIILQLTEKEYALILSAVHIALDLQCVDTSLLKKVDVKTAMAIVKKGEKNGN